MNLGQHRPWDAVTTVRYAAATAALLLLAALLATDDDGYLRVLDDANLVFHEAGHPIFGIFGPTLGLYGGTLGQLVFPSILSAVFWFKGQPLGVVTGVVWFFENHLNIARYMADARAQALPLVGGGDHDWAHIFSHWGVIRADTRIAAVVEIIGWIGMTGAWVWLTRRWWVWRSGDDRDSRRSPRS